MNANERGMALPLALLLIMLLSVLLEGAGARLQREVVNVNREFSALERGIVLTQRVEEVWRALERGIPVTSLGTGEICIAVGKREPAHVCPWLPSRDCQALEVAAWYCHDKQHGEKIIRGGWRVAKGSTTMAMVPEYWRWE